MNTRQARSRIRQQQVERRQQVAALRLAGERDQTALARRLGVSQATISRDLAALDAQWRADAAADIARDKGIQHERLERLFAKLWPDADAQHLFTVDRVIALLAREARLLGLDAPAKQEHRGSALAEVVIRQYQGVDVEQL